jgi:hypothetical protein
MSTDTGRTQGASGGAGIDQTMLKQRWFKKSEPVAAATICVALQEHREITMTFVGENSLRRSK